MPWVELIALPRQAFDRLKAKRSLIASDVLKAVKKFFEDDQFTDQSQVKKYAWWALRPDGPAYQADPTPIDCPLDPESPQYIVSE